MKALFRRFRRAKAYRERDFRQRERFRADYREIARHLLSELEFRSAYDVGCANGFLLSEFQDAGKSVGGVELSPEAVAVLPPSLHEVVAIGDFAAGRGAWDLVCCIEVAEHIPPERSPELVGKVVELARKQIYFSAAPPGQSGRGHINCRPHDEWLSWFSELGWSADDAATERLRRRITTLGSVPWLAGNSWLLRPARSGRSSRSR